MDKGQFAAGKYEYRHLPVLYREVTEYLTFSGPCRIIDGTVGNGGHSSLLLKANPQAQLLGIDRDGDALERAGKTLEFARDRVRLVRGNFSWFAAAVREAGWTTVDGILLDIGVSSPQLDDAERGFSLRRDGPLDMRMDRQSPVTASRILNNSPEAELARIFRDYGEERRSRQLAREIVERRAEKPFGRTLEFAAFCETVLGKSRPGKLPMPTKCFQALRIAVNDELGELKRALTAAVPLLNCGGRLAVISFHSLEDRIVKEFFRNQAAACNCPPGLPVCVCKHSAQLKILTRRPVTARADETAYNRRASSAKLRVAEKVQ
ncbi:MAG: 16S rRNA (cytosine(1402)-N(4))-methyltransferase RsmH [Victivallaceae bacterium]|nr:16S rRNA (cytosine(1402)-N(4))-methyltransferase RsmH [Victivallaceae bacterium]